MCCHTHPQPTEYTSGLPAREVHASLLTSDGPEVYSHKYFRERGWERNIKYQIWDKNFGFIQDAGSAVVLNIMGAGNKEADLTWQDLALSYARERGLGFFYYRLNPVCSERASSANALQLPTYACN